MAETPTRHRASSDQPLDVQQKFGVAAWVWAIGSGLLVAIMIVMLIMSLTGFWSNPWIDPPV